MKKILPFLVIIIFILGAYFLITMWPFRDAVVAPPIPPVDEVVVVEKYIRDNIQTLAPEKPVLGGNWYVTDVYIDPTTKTGTMRYEDGHIQGSASFTYRLEMGQAIIENITSADKKDTSARIAAGYVAGHVTIGPFCPVERADQPCKVPPEAYTSREAVVYLSDQRTVTERAYLDMNGNFKIALAPGNYFVQIVPAGIGPGEKKPVTVKSFTTSTVDFEIDTGIR